MAIQEDLNATPVAVESGVQRSFMTGSVSLNVFVPRNEVYYERLAGRCDSGQSFEGFLGSSLPLHVRDLIAWDSLRGVATGRLTLDQFVRITSANSAKLFGLWPRKGRIADGADADLVLIDPDRTMTLAQDLMQSRSDYDPFTGIDVTGWPALRTWSPSSVRISPGIISAHRPMDGHELRSVGKSSLNLDVRDHFRHALHHIVATQDRAGGAAGQEVQDAEHDHRDQQQHDHRLQDSSD